jgi:hypothetical protein
MDDVFQASEQDLSYGRTVHVHVGQKFIRCVYLRAPVLITWQAILDRKVRINNGGKRKWLHRGHIKKFVEFRGQ